MGLRISEKELDLLDSRKKGAVIVRSGRSKKGYAVISKTVCLTTKGFIAWQHYR